ncbi:MAG: SRPBCC domain-containing protein [Candidatus Nitrosotenuis sp.]|nr:MAG: SRPBCC domain-containing protein [Candidatus Nitrosotenuis sp.]
MSDLEIRKTIEINASPEIVFRALSIPEEITQWFPDQAILEPKVGGKMKFTFFSKGAKPVDRDFFPEGEIIEFVPNKKLSYTWTPQDIQDFPRTIVTWSLEQIGQNKTRVTMTHSGFTGKPHELFKEHSYGWDYFANRLAEYCKKK